MYTEERKIERRRKRNNRRFVAILALLVIMIAVGVACSMGSKGSGNDTSGKVVVKEKGKDGSTDGTKDNNSNTDGNNDSATSGPSNLVKGSNHIESAASYAYDTKKIRDYMTGAVPYTGKKMVFLTFDDGPNNVITPGILDVLKEKKVPATFFVVGKHVTNEHKDVLMRELNEGHSIAMHSFNHNYGQLYPGRVGSKAEIKKQADQTQQALQDILGKDFKSNVWRYPGGHMSWKNLPESGDKVLEADGIQWIDWNALCGDAEPKKVRPTTVDGMVEYCKTSLSYYKHKDVAVVLMHDAQDKQLTLKALPMIIDYYKSQGFEFGILK